MYLNTINFNDTTEEDINFLFKKDNKFIMPERLRKINYNRTTKDINQNVPWFSIYSSTLERTLFKEDWKEICLIILILFLIIQIMLFIKIG